MVSLSNIATLLKAKQGKTNQTKPNQTNNEETHEEQSKYQKITHTAHTGH